MSAVMSGAVIRWFCAGATALAAATTLTRCAVGPDFVHPAPPEIVRYTREPLAPRIAAAAAPGGQVQRFSAGGDIPLQWWTLFKSPALNAVIVQALANNPNLQAALASLRAARENVLAQEGKYFPFVQANFNPTRQRTSAALSPVPASNATIFDLDTAQLTVTYTFDIWGLNRRTVESLEALADVQRFQAEAAYLSLTANLAVAAITEASLRGQIDATQEIIGINTKMRDTLRRQLDAGYANRSDVAAQEAALAQAEATLPPLRRALEQQRDLIAALAGAYAGQGPAPVFRLADLHLPADLPVSLPSQLIEQRPDVRAAEEQLHSASAQIGVATANLLPSFTIDANAGFANTALAHLLAPQNLFWELGANVTQTVFDGGSLLHQLQGAKDTYQAAAWTYRGTVIGAVQNVADSLRALQNDAAALRAAADFERAAKVSFDLSRQQMQTGNANVLLLLNAQQGYLQAVLQVVQARAARLADTAALFQALGGGWWNRPEPPAAQVLDVGTGQATPLTDTPRGF
ncbi:MAG TPA: efflux transporter outer membrane subunit [Xanthobacteraceae bacterium]|jgi:NodT family efflux transporter outer membrane factor (OMF) lipoprotein|nr:efflux transporter outer membrane subunit [Xanthobacteraceae bacterium]